MGTEGESMHLVYQVNHPSTINLPLLICLTIKLRGLLLFRKFGRYLIYVYLPFILRTKFRMSSKFQSLSIDFSPLDRSLAAFHILVTWISKIQVDIFRFVIFSYLYNAFRMLKKFNK